VVIFQIWDDDELDFPFRQWTQFTSLEDANRRHLVDPGQLRAAYLQKLAEFREQLGRGCSRQRVSLVPLTTSQPCADALAAWLAIRRRAQMTLLNPLLILGAVAFLVPLLIHIFNRSRFRTVEWGAMHLLESVISQNRRRFRINQLILLLIRCLIPAILAACLARPVLTGTGLSGEAPVGLVLLLDNSYSMEAAEPAGTRFSLAVDAACQLLANLPRGSQATVVLSGGRPTLLFDRPLSDRQSVIRRLRQLQPGYGASDIAGSLQLGMEQLQNMTTVRRQLIVISDLQAADWAVLSAGPAGSIQKQLQTSSIPTELLVLPIAAGQQLAKADNVAIESIELPQQPVGVGQDFLCGRESEVMPRRTSTQRKSP
jgi:hypothetical protein